MLSNIPRDNESTPERHTHKTDNESNLVVPNELKDIKKIIKDMK